MKEYWKLLQRLNLYFRLQWKIQKKVVLHKTLCAWDKVSFLGIICNDIEKWCTIYSKIGIKLLCYRRGEWVFFENEKYWIADPGSAKLYGWFFKLFLKRKRKCLITLFNYIIIDWEYQSREVHDNSKRHRQGCWKSQPDFIWPIVI